MPFLEKAQNVWTFVVSPTLPTPFNYVPLAFRLLAILIATPFVLFIALELVAYAIPSFQHLHELSLTAVITRTLHISISNLRVPRSPPAVPRDLAPVAGDPDPDAAGDDGDEGEDEIADHLGPSYPTPAADEKQPFSRAFGAAARQRAVTPAAIALITVLVALAAAGFHFLVARGNERTALALQAGLFGDVTANTSKPVAVVLTAHPDDEAMFFAPTILNLVAAGWGVLPICVSTGNADGLGALRAAELEVSYARLGIKNALVLDNPQLPDSMGPDGQWDAALIAALITPYIKTSKATHLLTFDERGVTQHPNHVALASVYEHIPDAAALQVLKLYSPPLASKFTGVMWAIFIAARDALRREPPHHAAFVSTPAQYATALYAMRAHASQLVWFRWLYVAFSRLMWVNQLIEE